MPAQPTGSQTLTSASTKFKWEITNFTQLTETSYCSRPFTVGIYSWKVLVYPKGVYSSPGYLSLFLGVANSENLPNGWAISADYCLMVVNQSTPYSSLKREKRNRNFCAGTPFRSHRNMITLEKVQKDGFLVNDTLIIEVGLVVKELRVDTSPDIIDTHFSSLEQYIYRVNDAHVSSDARCPTLDEVEDAKRSLKECLSDLFKLNVKDRLAEALSTLSRAEVGLSAGQASSVRAFWDRFGEFTSDFLIFEQDNAEFELHKLLKDEMLSKMKRCHEVHMSFKKQSKKLAKEEAECERMMEELSKRKEELIKIKEKLESDWEVLMAESQEAKSKYTEHEKKAKEAEEKKRIAEERMSRSTTAWSNLKLEFA